MDTQVNIVTTLSSGVLSNSYFESRQEQNVLVFSSPHSLDLFMGPYSILYKVSGIMFSPAVKWGTRIADYSCPSNKI